MAVDEGRNVLRQALGQRRRAGEHAHAALHTLAVGVQLDAHLVQPGQQLAGARQQCLAGGRGLNATPPPRQQRHANLRLQRGDALAQRGCDQRLSRRRPGDVPFFAHGDEVLQRDGVERTAHDVPDWNARAEQSSFVKASGHA
jgi:hypothetical protein